MSQIEVFPPEPGTDLVPDGWAESTVVPWLAEQTDASALVTASAQLAGLEAAYKTLNADTFELVKARRFLEARWGELLPDAEEAMLAGKADPSGASEGLSKDQREDFRRLAKNRERIEALIREADDADLLSRNALLRAVNGAHVGHNSGDSEWFTPEPYIKSARAVMGDIDLDPGSTAEANEVIGATMFYGEADDGLSKPWQGRVWMNPPYARPLIDNFCAKLTEEYAAGNVTQACVLVNNATETGWFHTLLEVASAVCFHRQRIRFWHPRKESATPLQGQTILYFGENLEAFRSEFLRFGFVVAL